MMQRVLERQLRVGFSLLCAVAWLTVSGASAQNTPALAVPTPPPLGSSPAAEPTQVSPAASASPNAAAPTPKPGKGGPGKTPHPKAANPNRPMSKEIPIPLPIDESAYGIKIPQVGLAGQLLSQLQAARMKRIDETHLEMEHMNIDLYQADGKSDFHIDIPTSIFDLKTRIIHSDNPVVVRTQDFELTGERMEFDTVERTGKLLGKVRMRVFNLKKVAGQSDETKKE